MKLQSGHESVPLEGAEWKRQERDWGGYPGGLVRLNPGRWLFPTAYEKYADKLYNFQFKKSDVVVLTWPKCGTTWTQEIVYTMRNNPGLIDPKTPIMARSPFIDMDMLLPDIPLGGSGEDNIFLKAFMKLCPGKSPADGINYQIAGAIPDPRTLKTHLPFSLLTPSLLDTAKVVYTARNPKDVIMSYYHHCRIIRCHNYVGSFEEYVQYFVDDDLLYGPYWHHLKEAWERRNHPNLHFMFFEDMKADPLKEVRRLNDFLETNLTDDQLKALVKYTSFSEMKIRNAQTGMKEEEMVASFIPEIVKSDGGFYRKGESGSWKGKLTPELEAKVDKWIQTHLDAIGIKFKYGA